MRTRSMLPCIYVGMYVPLKRKRERGLLLLHEKVITIILHLFPYTRRIHNARAFMRKSTLISKLLKSHA